MFILLTVHWLSFLENSASIAKLKVQGFTFEHVASMASVVQSCSKRLIEDFTWQSQPKAMGRYSVGNIMTSLGILMSGINIRQAMLMLRHMNLHTIGIRTYH